MIPSKDEARETPQPSRNEPAAPASSKPPKKEIKQEKSTEKPATVATGRKAQIGRERTKTTRSLDEYEQQAMIIAGLNYELFSLLTVLFLIFYKIQILFSGDGKEKQSIGGNGTCVENRQKSSG